MCCRDGRLVVPEAFAEVGKIHRRRPRGTCRVLAVKNDDYSTIENACPVRSRALSTAENSGRRPLVIVHRQALHIEFSSLSELGHGWGGVRRRTHSCQT